MPWSITVGGESETASDEEEVYNKLKEAFSGMDIRYGNFSGDKTGSRTFMPEPDPETVAAETSADEEQAREQHNAEAEQAANDES